MAWVIIPAYRPDKEMISVADQMWECGYKLLIVDDGSGEEYRAIFDAVSDICVVLRHPENRGKGAAIKSALSYIMGKREHRDVIGIMDADGQHLPEDMVKLLATAEAIEGILVLGVRSVGEKMPLRSRLGNENAETCVLNWDGTMDIYSPNQVDIQKLIKNGAYQSWIFGPSLLDENGKAKKSFYTWDYIRKSHPRTAIGYYEPGHYCLLLVDGRQLSTRGMFPSEMAQLFEKLGCKSAYNLDGGHCSFMTYKDQVVNHPYKPEHQVSDGIFITEGL